MCEETKHPRRRFLSNAAMGMPGAQLAMMRFAEGQTKGNQDTGGFASLRHANAVSTSRRRLRPAATA